MDTCKYDYMSIGDDNISLILNFSCFVSGVRAVEMCTHRFAHVFMATMTFQQPSNRQQI